MQRGKQSTTTTSSSLAKTQTSATCVSVASVLDRLRPKLLRKFHKPLICALGEKISDRWIIKGLIGGGGYGQIYFAVDSRGEDTIGVAIKTERKRSGSHTAKRMILEQKVLLRLQGRAHVPLMWGSGSNERINYIILQLLSINIGDIRKQSPLKRFSRSTMARIVIQGVAGLRDLHQIGYIHRDIKPQNMCTGLTEASKHRIVIVDFGLARKFRHLNGRLRPLRVACGFRGTSLYASLRSHKGKDLGPSDDLTSLFYTAIELVRGGLPWRHARLNEEIMAAKEAINLDDFNSISRRVGGGLREFGRAVMCMDADDEPNYAALQSIMEDFTDNKKLSDPYDWDNEFEEVLREDDLNRELRKNGI